jgi:peptidoglycan/xylan/chitin deacetylase (PgdA/CDA1 family)
MITVYAMHGVVEHRNRNRATHRGMSDAKRFADFLQRRKESFSHLDNTLRLGGFSITVDDATKASAEAALLARKHNHAVTMFVNPSYIQNQQEHFFCILSSAIDDRTLNSVRWGPNMFDMSNVAEARRFRDAIKGELRSTLSESDRLEILQRVAFALGCDNLRVHDHLRTLSLAELQELVDRGVDIQNHGWTHGEIAGLSEGDQQEEIVQGMEWLQIHLGTKCMNYYAVPFGETMPKRGVLDQLGIECFLADDRLPAGRLDAHVVNRVNVLFA